MFTGIIETAGTITDVTADGSNLHFWVRSTITHELKTDQSVAHNGVCLTVVAIQADTYKVTAVAETLAKTNLATWRTGDTVNIERALKVGDRLDGHFVQGHVDTTATCIEKQTLEGSWLFRFRFPEAFAALVIEKGSICINGVSLTVFNVGRDECTVTIIPYTYKHTNFHAIENGSIVNIEFDVLGKYLWRRQDPENALQPNGGPQPRKIVSYIATPALETAFIIFLFYSNLLMGAFTRSGIAHGSSFGEAIADIFTTTNFLIAIIAALAGHFVFSFFREKL